MNRRPFFTIVVSAALIGCPGKSTTTTSTATAPPGATSVAATPSATTAATDRATSSSSSAAAAAAADPDPVPAFLKSTPLAAGPIVVKGYPHELRNGMNDAANRAGFSKDSITFGYCGQGGGIESTRCEFVDRSGKVTKMNSTEGEKVPAEIAKKKAIDEFLKDKEIPKITLENAADIAKVQAPALTGSWTFTDITIDVVRTAAIIGMDKRTQVSAPTIKVGGTVTGEATPVHSITLGSPNADKVPPHFIALNAFAISPDGKDIGMIGTFFGGEYSDVFTIKRMPIGAFASLVYNDTGFRHHQKSNFAKSAELFAKAVAADPSAKLPAYNLACAWARLKEPRAKDALAFAITKDPTAKTRAPKDKDFEGVKSEAWFTDLTK